MTGQAWWHPLGSRGAGFWFRVRGYGVGCMIVKRGYRPFYDERHGSTQAYYIPLGFGRKLRIAPLAPEGRPTERNPQSEK